MHGISAYNTRVSTQNGGRPSHQSLCFRFIFGFSFFFFFFGISPRVLFCRTKRDTFLTLKRPRRFDTSFFLCVIFFYFL